jgi:hypothetical protein
VHYLHLTRYRMAACVAASIAGQTTSAQPQLDLVIGVDAQTAGSVRAKHQPFAISNVRVFDGARGNVDVVVDNGIPR